MSNEFTVLEICGGFNKLALWSQSNRVFNWKSHQVSFDFFVNMKRVCNNLKFNGWQLTWNGIPAKTFIFKKDVANIVHLLQKYDRILQSKLLRTFSKVMPGDFLNFGSNCRWRLHYQWNVLCPYKRLRQTASHRPIFSICKGVSSKYWAFSALHIRRFCEFIYPNKRNQASSLKKVMSRRLLSIVGLNELKYVTLYSSPSGWSSWNICIL